MAETDFDKRHEMDPNGPPPKPEPPAETPAQAAVRVLQEDKVARRDQFIAGYKELAARTRCDLRAVAIIKDGRIDTEMQIVIMD